MVKSALENELTNEDSYLSEPQGMNINGNKEDIKEVYAV